MTDSAKGPKNQIAKDIKKSITVICNYKKALILNIEYKVA